MNITDQWSDADIEQAIANFEAVASLCKIMRDSLDRKDKLRDHFAAVISFCGNSVVESRKLLKNRKIELAYS